MNLMTGSMCKDNSSTVEVYPTCCASIVVDVQAAVQHARGREQEKVG